MSFEIHNGRPVAPGFKIRHSCDNPPCVNPRHLVEGTQADNLRDMRVRGRGHPPPPCRTRGEANPLSKLTYAQVCEIRRLRTAGRMQKDLAVEFEVSEATISGIVTGKLRIDC